MEGHGGPQELERFLGQRLHDVAADSLAWTASIEIQDQADAKSAHVQRWPGQAWPLRVCSCASWDGRMATIDLISRMTPMARPITCSVNSSAISTSSDSRGHRGPPFFLPVKMQLSVNPTGRPVDKLTAYSEYI
jgi:hypothetical protein